MLPSLVLIRLMCDLMSFKGLLEQKTKTDRGIGEERNCSVPVGVLLQFFFPLVLRNMPDSC